MTVPVDSAQSTGTVDSAQSTATMDCGAFKACAILDICIYIQVQSGCEIAQLVKALGS